MSKPNISLDWIPHDEVRVQIQERLDKMDMSESDIIALEIVYDKGYYYKVVVKNRFSFTVFHNGH